jgi:hypothetical protein
MQTTNVSAFSLRMLLKQNVEGIKVVGYTVRPGYSNGLMLGAKQPVGQTVGFSFPLAVAHKA